MSKPACGDCSSVSDENLMAEYAAGKVESFDELFRRYERAAYSFFVKRTGSPERARDLYQELFLRVHRARDAYDSTRPFTPWFFRIAHRLLVDDFRRAFRHREVPFDDALVSAAGGEQSFVDRDELARLMSELTPEERYVLCSSKLAGTEHSEIAAQLGKSADAVKKMASRAMQKLRSRADPAVAVRAPG